MTVPQSHSYSHEQRPAVKRALCLVEKETLCRVKETFELLGWRLDEVDTIPEAVNALQFDKYEAVITSISTSKASLFDESTFDENSRAIVYKSSFLQHLILQAPSTFRIVYGFEAVELEDIRQACHDCGANAVVNSQEGLFDLLFGLGATAATSTSTSRDTSDRDSDPLVRPSGGRSPTQRTLRSQQLLQSAAVSIPNAASLGSEPTTQQLASHPESPTIADLVRDPTDEMPLFEIMVPSCSDFVPPLLEDESCRNLDFSEYRSNIYRALGTGPRVRVVHVSDTIGLHRRLVLPEGDIFLHAGNFTNGKPQTWLSQFVDFLDWIHDEVLSSFRLVAFIAGSNDIFLDTIACKYNAASREAQKVLNRFLSAHESVAFLENSSITYRGLKIHGSSTTLLKGGGGDDDEGSTLEGKHGAFERELKGFFRPEIDDECDILLTHRPPSFLFSQPSYELLTDRLYHNTEVEEEQTPGPNQGGKKKLSFSFRKNALSDSRRGTQDEESTRSFPLLFRKDNARTTSLQPKQKLLPRVHAFGHYGKDFGVENDANTLLLNGSQDRFLQSEKDGRGIPLAVDVPLFRC